MSLDAELRKEATQLRAMGSEAAASYLIERWPNAHRHACILMEHLSWKTADQNRLAKHFLKKEPFANTFPYDAFASFMSAERFLEAIDRVWPDDEPDRQLLMYHISGILRRYEAVESNKAVIERFLLSHGP